MRISRFSLASCLLLPFALAGPFDASAEVLAAGGNEPSWRVEISEDKLVFRTLTDEISISPVPGATTTNGILTYEASKDGQLLSLEIREELCNDTMSGMPHPKAVRITYGDQELSGCGGDPATLLRGEWLITTIDGNNVAINSVPEMKFDAEGGVSGNGSCNRIFGSYTLTGEALTFEPFGSTRMFCEPPAMDQERLFLQALEEVDRFDFDSEENLILLGTDRVRITARRK